MDEVQKHSDSECYTPSLDVTSLFFNYNKGFIFVVCPIFGRNMSKK
jgi:hypothetical protein